MRRVVLRYAPRAPRITRRARRACVLPSSLVFRPSVVPSFSRPIFDPLDDSDDEDASPRDARAPEDAADEDEDDDARIAARLDDEARDALDEAFPLGDGVADMSATVWCPYCGEPTEVAIDPGGGAAQEYVEDCAVCCRPWRVTVAYGADGGASVSAVAADE